MKQMSVEELARLREQGEAFTLLDVREPWEFQRCAIPRSLHLPMGSIPSRLEDIPRDLPVVCLCHHGARSMQVAIFLERQGFAPVYNLEGGIDAWSRRIDPTCPTY